MQSVRTHTASSTEAVTARLRELILTGALPQGERVTESGLAAMLEVSRTPVRLALATLEQEDLVEGVPNRGFRVRRFTLDDIREIIEVRANLEGMAARLAAENGATREQEAVLSRCVDEVDTIIAENVCERAVFQRFSDINVRFHKTIAEISGNATLERLLARVTTLPFLIAPLVYVLPDDEAFGTIIEGQRDHVRLVEAIQQGQGARAEFLMREHALMPLSRAALLLQHTGAASLAPREAV